MLLEFKRSEGISQGAFRQILAYDALYAENQSLAREELASFPVSASTPATELLRDSGYRPGAQPGVYYSDQWVFQPIGVILLNELRPLSHNGPLKCFATRRQEQAAALKVFRDSELLAESLELSVCSMVCGESR